MFIFTRTAFNRLINANAALLLLAGALPDGLAEPVASVVVSSSRHCNPTDRARNGCFRNDGVVKPQAILSKLCR